MMRNASRIHLTIYLYYVLFDMFDRLRMIDDPL
jgi:hypothetical protein